MNLERFLPYLARVLTWLGAIALIAMTSSLIKGAWNDAVYVVNGAYLLFGGAWIGTWLADLIRGCLRRLSPRGGEAE